MSKDESLFFAERPEWADITPLEQYGTLNPLAPIIYTEEYKDATGYFRAIVKTGEKSLRVLELTETIIKLNPAHYTAWQYRYETLLALLFPDSPPKPSKSLASHPLITSELSLMDQLAVLFLKTYQVWHHRRLLVSLTLQPKKELEFIKESLKSDAKNYHTWSYRQWILAFFGGAGGRGVGVLADTGDVDEEEEGVDVWEGELDFVNSMLVQDLRNNSAWHHRFFIVWGSGVREGESDREALLQRELSYVKEKIALAPNNPSAWNYLRGVLSTTSTPLSSVSTFVQPYTVTSREEIPKDEVVVDLENPLPGDGADLPCGEALEFLADVYEAQADDNGVFAATVIWKSLAKEHDPIRKKYWEYRSRTALQALKSELPA